MPGPLAIEVVLQPGERLEGVATGQGTSTVRRFSGWIDFMAAINEIRRQHQTG